MESPIISCVFVYGTLKPSLRYYSVAEKGGAFSKQEASIEGFDLYHLEPENYPAIVQGTGKVQGWVYDYEDIYKALIYLDELEGLHVKPPEYKRIVVNAQLKEQENSTKEVWVYEFLKLAEHNAFKLESGIWLPNEAHEGVKAKGLESY